MNATRSLFLVGIAFFLSAPVLCQGEEALSWDDCVRMTLQASPDLASARKKAEQAGALLSADRSRLYPQVSADGSASFPDSGDRSASLGVTGRQLLYDGKKTSSAVDASSEQARSAEQSYRASSALVRRDLRNAFTDLLKAQEYLALTQEIESIREQNLRLVQLRYEAGREHKGSLMVAQANLAQAQFELGQARRSIEVAQQNLLRLLGSGSLHGLKVSGAFEISSDIQNRPDLDKIVEQNPLLLKMVHDRKAAEYDLLAAKAEYYPSLYATAGARQSESEFSSESDINAGLAVSMPLFDGGKRKADTDAAQAVLDQRNADERGRKNEILSSLTSAWNTLQNAAAGVTVQEKFLTASEERSRITAAQYESGLISFDNWTIIEDELVRNKKNFLNARAAVLSAEADWMYARGASMEDEKM